MPHVDRECITHHHACDCREAHFKRLEERLRAAEAVLEKEAFIRGANPDYFNMGRLHAERDELFYAWRRVRDGDAG